MCGPDGTAGEDNKVVLSALQRGVGERWWGWLGEEEEEGLTCLGVVAAVAKPTAGLSIFVDSGHYGCAGWKMKCSAS